MPSMEKIKGTLSQIWDILKVLSVIFLMTSTIISASIWLGANVFYPNSIAIEITKYFILVLIPTTVSTIMLQAYIKSLERKTETLKKEIPKIESLNAQVKNLSEINQQAHKNLSDRFQRVHENLQYFNNVFAIQCPNPTCRQWISIPIPASLVKGIHPVDGRPTGVVGLGREMQIRCEACEQVYHIVHP